LLARLVGGERTTFGRRLQPRRSYRDFTPMYLTELLRAQNVLEADDRVSKVVIGKVGTSSVGDKTCEKNLAAVAPLDEPSPPPSLSQSQPKPQSIADDVALGQMSNMVRLTLT